MDPADEVFFNIVVKVAPGRLPHKDFDEHALAGLRLLGMTSTDDIGYWKAAAENLAMGQQDWVASVYDQHSEHILQCAVSTLSARSSQYTEDAQEFANIAFVRACSPPLGLEQHMPRAECQRELFALKELAQPDDFYVCWSQTPVSPFPIPPNMCRTPLRYDEAMRHLTLVHSLGIRDVHNVGRQELQDMSKHLVHYFSSQLWHWRDSGAEEDVARAAQERSMISHMRFVFLPTAHRFVQPDIIGAYLDMDIIVSGRPSYHAAPYYLREEVAGLEEVGARSQHFIAALRGIPDVAPRDSSFLFDDPEASVRPDIAVVLRGGQGELLCHHAILALSSETFRCVLPTSSARARVDDYAIYHPSAVRWVFSYFYTNRFLPPDEQTIRGPRGLSDTDWACLTQSHDVGLDVLRLVAARHAADAHLAESAKFHYTRLNFGSHEAARVLDDPQISSKMPDLVEVLLWRFPGAIGDMKSEAARAVLREVHQGLEDLRTSRGWLCLKHGCLTRNCGPQQQCTACRSDRE